MTAVDLMVPHFFNNEKEREKVWGGGDSGLHDFTVEDDKSLHSHVPEKG